MTGGCRSCLLRSRRGPSQPPTATKSVPTNKQSAPEEDGCEEPVLGVTDAVAQDADEPEKRDPRERDETEGEQHRASARAVREPTPLRRTGSAGTAARTSSRATVKMTEKAMPATAAARGVLSARPTTRVSVICRSPQPPSTGSPSPISLTPKTRNSTVITAALCTASHSFMESSAALALVAAHQVVDDGPGDGDAAEDDEDDQRDDRVRRRRAELGERRAGTGREQEVLRVHAREQQGERERLDGENASMPAIHFGISGAAPGARPAAPLLGGDQEEEDADRDLPPRDGVTGGAVGRGVAGVRQRVGDDAHDAEGDDPAGQEHRPVHPRAGREQHQDHGDDRHGADRHADRVGQDLADALRHDSSSRFEGRRGDPRRPVYGQSSGLPGWSVPVSRSGRAIRAGSRSYVHGRPEAFQPFFSRIPWNTLSGSSTRLPSIPSRML